MLYLIQDIQEKAHAETASPHFDKISQFVSLITAASAPIAPPVAILGLTYAFVSWLSNVVLDNMPSTQNCLVGYTVDLILVLECLFLIKLPLPRIGATSWKEVQEAFESYERSESRPRVHDEVRSGPHQYNPDNIRDRVKELVLKFRQDS